MEKLCLIIDVIAIICIAPYYVIKKCSKKHRNFKKIITKLLEEQKIINKIGLNKKIQEYFKTIPITVKISLKFFTFETGVNKKNTKIAWKFFILLVTSVLANKSKGLVSEATTSLLNIFNKSKNLLIEDEAPILITELILKIINLKIRPILIKTREFKQIKQNNLNIILMKMNLLKIKKICFEN